MEKHVPWSLALATLLSGPSCRRHPGTTDIRIEKVG
jgi:hypothetical protein